MSFDRNHHHSIISSSQYDHPQSSRVTSSNRNRNYNRPLINSAVASTNNNDTEIARQQQEHLYDESLMDVDESPLSEVATSFNPRQLEDIDADAAYALQLQEEEYSRNSIVPFQSYKRGSNNKNSPPIIIDSDDGPVLSDAELAAHLQAEENQKQQRRRQRPAFPSQRRISHQTANRDFQLDEPEVIPIPPVAGSTHHRPSSGGINNRNNNDISTLFQPFLSRGRPFLGVPRSGGRGTRNIQPNDDDFGPEQYEDLLELDNSIKKKGLTQEQINRLPTEKFRRPANKNTEENKCSICMDEFEQNQIVRRLPCLHLYHKDCVDKWLKTSNLCPICRIPSIK